MLQTRAVCVRAEFSRHTASRLQPVVNPLAKRVDLVLRPRRVAGHRLVGQPIVDMLGAGFDIFVLGKVEPSDGSHNADVAGAKQRPDITLETERVRTRLSSAGN